jgi:16S rRNA processing protein RimM
MEATFCMGKIVNTHGIKGEIKIYPYTDDPTRFEHFSYILIEGEADNKFKVSSVRVHKNMVLLKLKGFNDINEVQKLMDKEVYIYRKDIEALDGDEGGHYVVDLIGCEIIDVDGNAVGILKDVLQHTAQDLYEVTLPSGGVFYIPVVDEFVKNVDIENRKITVKMIEGLIE